MPFNYDPVPFFGYEGAWDTTQPTGDDEGEELFDSDAYADNGEEDTTMGSPTGESDI